MRATRRRWWLAIGLVGCAGSQPAREVTPVPDGEVTPVPGVGAASAPTKAAAPVVAVPATTSSAASAPTRQPRPARDDPHAFVLAESDEFHCHLLGVEGGSAYVGSDEALFGIPVDLGARRTVFRGPMGGSLRTAGALAIRRQPGQHFLERYHLVSLADGSTRELADAAYVTAWTTDATNVYWADDKYDDPRVWTVPFSGGEPKVVEELAAVGNEDRIGRIVVRDGKATVQVKRRWLHTGSGRACQEIRHGTLGKTRPLWRDQACIAGKPTRGSVQGLSVSPGYVYFSRGDALWRVARRGGRPELLFDRQAFAQFTWSDDAWLVWSNHRKLFRIRLDRGAKVADPLADDVVQANAVHVVEGHVYWTQRTPEGPCQVRRRALDAPAR